MLLLGFGRIVTTIPPTMYRQVSECRPCSGEQCSVFYPYLKICAPHRDTEIVAIAKQSARQVHYQQARVERAA